MAFDINFQKKERDSGIDASYFDQLL